MVRLGSLRTVKWAASAAKNSCVPKRKGDNPKATGRQKDVDDARVTNNETLVRRGKKWFRYDAPDKRLFKKLQKTLTAQH